MFNYEEILCALVDFRKSRSFTHVPSTDFLVRKITAKKHLSENFTKIILIAVPLCSLGHMIE